MMLQIYVGTPPPATSDAHLLRCSTPIPAAVLVTGDHRLLTAEVFRGRAHSPAEALETAGD
jgi:hypothetical protein